MPGDARYEVLDAQRKVALQDSERDFALDVLVGLSEKPKRLPSKYFYDDAGSEYFRRIMALDEYYPTACENEILERHGTELAARVAGQRINVVDVGAGDGKKTVVLLRQLAAAGIDFVYVPIDISEGAMQTLSETIGRELPDVTMRGLVSDYADGIHWLGVHHAERLNLALFLGSNIGNFDRARARAFLRRLWNELREDDLVLVGFDLKKDIDVLLDAYNDSEGVTAAFNLNLLERINRELGGTFDLDKWRHYGTYDVLSGAMKSYLVSLEPQRVYIDALSHEFEFQAWESIHTEYSYKYLKTDITELAADTGFVIEAQYGDSRGYFVDSLWRVNKPAGPT